MASKLGTSKSGDVAEMAACAYLLATGVEVFRNVSSTGVVDVCTLDAERNLIKYDVKRCNLNGGVIYLNNALSNRDAFDYHGVRILYVYVSEPDENGLTIIVDEDGDNFLRRVALLGVRTPLNTSKFKAQALYTIQDTATQEIYEILGMESLRGHFDLTSPELNRLIAGRPVRSLILIDRAKVRAEYGPDNKLISYTHVE